MVFSLRSGTITRKSYGGTVCVGYLRLTLTGAWQGQRVIDRVMDLAVKVWALDIRELNFVVFDTPRGGKKNGRMGCLGVAGVRTKHPDRLDQL